LVYAIHPDEARDGIYGPVPACEAESVTQRRARGALVTEGFIPSQVPRKGLGVGPVELDHRVLWWRECTRRTRIYYSCACDTLSVFIKKYYYSSLLSRRRVSKDPSILRVALLQT